ncbi:hypothetical protein D623_10004132 [Myotis brandtii]|uniref:Uncharacterized protein n=1 Tax=Myotis brandtii TaxID=109478 RepID=S7NV43_MYOBR|nr:hypothetical protein D623_10004132 [Myotis brandtii]
MDSNLPRPLPSAPLAGRQHPCRNLRQPSGSRSYSLFAAGPAGWIRGKRGPFLFANHPGPFLVPGTGRTNIDPAAVICKHHSPWLEAAQHRRPGPAWRLSTEEKTEQYSPKPDDSTDAADVLGALLFEKGPLGAWSGSDPP